MQYIGIPSAFNLRLSIIAIRPQRNNIDGNYIYLFPQYLFSQIQFSCGIFIYPNVQSTFMPCPYNHCFTAVLIATDATFGHGGFNRYKGSIALFWCNPFASLFFTRGVSAYMRRELHLIHILRHLQRIPTLLLPVLRGNAKKHSFCVFLQTLLYYSQHNTLPQQVFCNIKATKFYLCYLFEF